MLLKLVLVLQELLVGKYLLKSVTLATHFTDNNRLFDYFRNS